MARGDHIKVRRFLYTHHGINLGDGWVIHYTGEVGKKSNASVQKDRIENFRNGGKIEVVQYPKCCLPVSEVVRKAESRLGEKSYSLPFNNCEHFARWCKTGVHGSEQVENAVSGVNGMTLSSLLRYTLNIGTKAAPPPIAITMIAGQVIHMDMKRRLRRLREARELYEYYNFKRLSNSKDKEL